MAKGKTNQPLSFVVPAEWVEKMVIQKLIEQGHSVTTLPKECMEADIVFGINCHIMTDLMLAQKGMLDTILRAARKRKKEKK